jgi:hypothetical protein
MKPDGPKIDPNEIRPNGIDPDKMDPKDTQKIDELLEDFAARPIAMPSSSAALAARRAILADLRPVRPLPAAGTLALAFLGLFASLAALSAAILGPHGLPALSPAQRAVIFPMLLAAAAAWAVACSRQMRPAGGARFGAPALLASIGLFPALFALLFRGYGVLNLVPQGIPCLLAGMGVAIPAGLAAVWLLRRGFVLDWSAAGLAAGVLAGLTGLAMLELHCPNLKAIHVLVWHVAVVALSAALGYGVGRIADARSA